MKCLLILCAVTIVSALLRTSTNIRTSGLQNTPRLVNTPFSRLYPLNMAKSTYTQPKINSKIMKMTRFLVDVWSKVCYPSESGEDLLVLKDYKLKRKSVKGFLKHFQTCKDCAIDNAFLMATQDDEGNDAVSLSSMHFPLAVEDENDEEWGQFDQSEEYLGKKIDVNTKPFPEEEDDDIVLADTKEWVQKVITDFGVCPFTTDPNRAGIPMGGVLYTVSRAKSADEAFFAFWQDVLKMLSVPEREIATVLLVFPELDLFGDYELFESYCECLGDALSKSSMNMEKEIQLVFFHPKYQFRDGQARTGEDMGAANFARRGPWPMVNILRTPQVRTAQKGVPTGIVYKQNEQRLIEVGTKQLEDMLYNRNWANLPSYKSQAKGARKKAEAVLEEQFSNIVNGVQVDGSASPSTSITSSSEMQEKNEGRLLNDAQAVQTGVQATPVGRGKSIIEPIAPMEGTVEGQCPFSVREQQEIIGTGLDPNSLYRHQPPPPPPPPPGPPPIHHHTQQQAVQEEADLVNADVSSMSVEELIQFADAVTEYLDFSTMSEEQIKQYAESVDKMLNANK